MTFLRKIVKNGVTCQISLPMPLMKAFGWQAGEYVTVRPQSNNILIIERGGKHE